MKKMLSFLLVATVLSGCGDAVQTVDWYKEHDTERNEMLKKCKNDVNLRDSDPNCQNAEQANIAKANARRGSVRLFPNGVPD